MIKDRTALEDKSKCLGETKMQEFWEICRIDQRPKLQVQINGIETVGLVDTGADVTIISQKSGIQIGLLG